MTTSMASLGWVQISRRAVEKARRALDGGGQGVLDEVGFLALHRGYADRFFPGTSVLHTRLRYVLFLGWLLDDLLHGAHGGRVDRAETWLVEKLRGAGNGVIGADVYQAEGRLPRQLPHEMYWTALGAWGVLLPTPDGELPRRRALLSRARLRAQVRDDDHTPLDHAFGFLRGLPERPASWSQGKLGFKIETDEERTWLAERLSSARFEGRRTVLSALVEHDVDVAPASDLFALALDDLVPPDEIPVLERAHRAASLAAIGRAVYAALVERMWVAEGHGQSTLFADSLVRLRDTDGDYARALDPADLDADVGGLPKQFLNLVGHLSAWLSQPRSDVADLAEVFAVEEQRKKGKRARLVRTTAGRQRRAEWRPDKHPAPVRLHYRWDNVRQLLVDLREGR
jgi:hypothetical protein